MKTRPARLLGIKIAWAYTPEARVFANLLTNRGAAYEAIVLHHDWPGDHASADGFERDASAPIVRLDAGWRPNPDGVGRRAAARLVSWLRYQRALSAMLSRARSYDPDVIYSSQQKWDSGAATLVARRLGRPQVIHLHYTIGPWLGGAPLRRLLRCDHVIAVSEFIRKEALRHGVPPERVTMIRNTIIVPPPALPGTREAVRGEFGIPPKAPVVGMVARLNVYKGQQNAIAAFAKVAPNHPDAHLLLVGEGELRSALAAQVAALGIEEKVRFAGQRLDVPRIHAALDVFMHPSRFEPFSLAVLEAQAAGLPVLAYAEGGVEEIVAPGETGMLAAPGDVDALARYLDELLGDPARARRMGAAGRRRAAELFRPEDAGRAFAALVSQMAGSGIRTKRAR